MNKGTKYPERGDRDMSENAPERNIAELTQYYNRLDSEGKSLTDEEKVEANEAYMASGLQAWALKAKEILGRRNTADNPSDPEQSSVDDGGLTTEQQAQIQALQAQIDAIRGGSRAGAIREKVAQRVASQVDSDHRRSDRIQARRENAGQGWNKFKTWVSERWSVAKDKASKVPVGVLNAGDAALGYAERTATTAQNKVDQLRARSVDAYYNATNQLEDILAGVAGSIDSFRPRVAGFIKDLEVKSLEATAGRLGDYIKDRVVPVLEQARTTDGDEILSVADRLAAEAAEKRREQQEKKNNSKKFSGLRKWLSARGS